MKTIRTRVSLLTYLKRIILNVGPHGKHCGCDKRCSYIGLTCANPTFKLNVNGKITKSKKFGEGMFSDVDTTNMTLPF